jgi:hypothetical protein
MAPPFKKLRNPILRRSVARVASLKQAAAVGRIDVHDMVNELRGVVGLPALRERSESPPDYFGEQPDWFDLALVVSSLDERELDEDTMPLGVLSRTAVAAGDGKITELVTGFLPAPGIDIMRGKGFRTWCRQDGPLVRTYFSRAAR